MPQNNARLCAECGKFVWGLLIWALMAYLMVSPFLVYQIKLEPTFGNDTMWPNKTNCSIPPSNYSTSPAPNVTSTGKPQWVNQPCNVFWELLDQNQGGALFGIFILNICLILFTMILILPVAGDVKKRCCLPGEESVPEERDSLGASTPITPAACRPGPPTSSSYGSTHDNSAGDDHSQLAPKVADNTHTSTGAESTVTATRPEATTSTSTAAQSASPEAVAPDSEEEEENRADDRTALEKMGPAAKLQFLWGLLNPLIGVISHSIFLYSSIAVHITQSMGCRNDYCECEGGWASYLYQFAWYYFILTNIQSYQVLAGFYDMLHKLKLDEGEYFMAWVSKELRQIKSDELDSERRKADIEDGYQIQLLPDSQVKKSGAAAKAHRETMTVQYQKFSDRYIKLVADGKHGEAFKYATQGNAMYNSSNTSFHLLTQEMPLMIANLLFNYFLGLKKMPWAAEQAFWQSLVRSCLTIASATRARAAFIEAAVNEHTVSYGLKDLQFNVGCLVAAVLQSACLLLAPVVIYINVYG